LADSQNCVRQFQIRNAAIPGGIFCLRSNKKPPDSEASGGADEQQD
jgi:hypothetical protein